MRAGSGGRGMTEIIFRLPSKQVQYGYVEVKTTAITNAPAAIGRLYAETVAEFWEGEKEGLANLVAKREGQPPPREAELDDVLKEDLGAIVIEETNNETGKPWVVKSDAPAPTKPWEKKQAPVKAPAKDGPMPSFDFD